MNKSQQLHLNLVKTIGLLQENDSPMLRSYLTIIYKSSAKLRLDHGDGIFDKIYNNSFYQKLGSFQYSVPWQ